MDTVIAKSDPHLIPLKWWRFDRYEIRDGFIRPAEGAQLSHYQPRPHTPGMTPRYEALRRLAEDITYSVAEDGRISLEPQSEALLLRWCQEHGLLGLLPQQTLSTVFVGEKWRLSGEGCTRLATLSAHDAAPAHGWISVDRHVARSGGVWHTTYTIQFAHGPTHTTQYLPRDLRPGSEAVLDHTAAVSSWAIVAPLQGPERAIAAALAAWAPFFPGIHDPSLYPEPLTDEFWHEYAEPVVLFLGALLSFRKMIEGSAITWDTSTSLKQMVMEKPLRAKADSLRRLFLDNTAIADVPENPTRLAFVAPSLFGWFGMLFAFDMSASVQPRVCARPVCNRIFYATSDTKRFHDSKCRNAELKKRFRHNQARKKKRNKTTQRTKDHRRGARQR